jgi:hypothetical protein
MRTVDVKSLLNNNVSLGAATDIGGPGPPHYRGFTITFRHTTLGTTPLDELSAHRRVIYLKTHRFTRHREPCAQW